MDSTSAVTLSLKGVAAYGRKRQKTAGERPKMDSTSAGSSAQQAVLIPLAVAHDSSSDIDDDAVEAVAVEWKEGW